jgi:hypothetical protein
MVVCVIGIAIIVSFGFYKYWTAIHKIATIRSVMSFPAISLHGNGPNTMTIFVRMDVKNPKATEVSYDNFRLKVATNDFSEEDIRPSVVKTPYTIYANYSIPLVKFRERFLYESARQPLKPGGQVCGWLVFQPSEFDWQDLRHKNATYIVSFVDSEHSTYEAKAEVSARNKTLPRDLPCSEQPFNLKYLSIISSPDVAGRQAAIEGLAQETLRERYPLGFTIFQIGYTNEVKTDEGRSYLKDYEFDSSVVRLLKNTQQQIELRLPDVKRNGKAIFTNAIIGGPKAINPESLSGVMFSDGSHRIFMSGEMIAASDQGIVFVVGLSSMDKPKQP